MAGSTSGISPSFLGLSRSSGQVTHVLLTRSRLCPGPKPGSSLHLHVLGTPPAFVLSQDQTLREELRGKRQLSHSPFTKSRQGNYNPHTARQSHASYGQNPGPIPGGIRPLRRLTPPARPVVGNPMYTRAPGARRGQSWHRRCERPSEGTFGRRRRTWTHSSTEGRSKGAHAVEFSKTVAPLQGGIPPQTARPRAQSDPGADRRV